LNLFIRSRFSGDKSERALNSNLKHGANLNLKRFVDKFVVKAVGILFFFNKQYYSLCVKLYIIENIFFVFITFILLT